MIIKILPRQTDKSLSVLDNNENLLTSTIYLFLQLIEGLQKNDVIKDVVVISELNDEPYDVIFSRWMDDEINNFDKSKPIYEFHYDGLNGGWFFERYTDGDKQYTPEDDNFNDILGDFFFRTNVNINSDL
jgi:hypothetical protein